MPHALARRVMQYEPEEVHLLLLNIGLSTDGSVEVQRERLLHHFHELIGYDDASAVPEEYQLKSGALVHPVSSNTTVSTTSIVTSRQSSVPCRDSAVSRIETVVTTNTAIVTTCQSTCVYGSNVITTPYAVPSNFEVSLSRFTDTVVGNGGKCVRREGGSRDEGDVPCGVRETPALEIAECVSEPPLPHATISTPSPTVPSLDLPTAEAGKQVRARTPPKGPVPTPAPRTSLREAAPSCVPTPRVRTHAPIGTPEPVLSSLTDVTRSIRQCVEQITDFSSEAEKETMRAVSLILYDAAALLHRLSRASPPAATVSKTTTVVQNTVSKTKKKSSSRLPSTSCAGLPKQVTAAKKTEKNCRPVPPSSYSEAVKKPKKDVAATVAATGAATDAVTGAAIVAVADAAIVAVADAAIVADTATATVAVAGTVAAAVPSRPSAATPGRTLPLNVSSRQSTVEVSLPSRRGKPSSLPSTSRTSSRRTTLRQCRSATCTAPCTSGSRTVRTRSHECWNCGQSGHRYSNCRKDRKKFCYRCGRSNVTVNTCRGCRQDTRRG